MKLTLPTSWKALTLGQYIELRPILLSDKDRIVKSIYTLSVLTGIPSNEIEKIPTEEYDKVSPLIEFLKTPPVEEAPERFQVNGQYYQPMLEMKDWNGGQYIDASIFLKDQGENGEFLYNNMHHVMAVLCPPVKKQGRKWVNVYDKDKHREYADAMLSAPMGTLYSLSVFFCNAWTLLQKNIQDYGDSQLTRAEDLLDTVKNLLNDGHGISPLTISAMAEETSGISTMT